MNQPHESDSAINKAINGILSTPWDVEMANAMASEWALVEVSDSLVEALADLHDELRENEPSVHHQGLRMARAEEVAQAFRAFATTLETKGEKSLGDITEAKEPLGIPRPSDEALNLCIQDIIRKTIDAYVEKNLGEIQILFECAQEKLTQIPDDINEMPDGYDNEEYPEAEHFHALFEESGDPDKIGVVKNNLFEEITGMIDEHTHQTMTQLLGEKLFAAPKPA